MSIRPPYWHPASSSGFLLDWDGVIAETKLDFSGVRERYYGGRRAMLLEEADTLSAKDKESLMKDLCDLEMNGAKRAKPVGGALELLKWLDSNKIPYCIVSRNCMQSIELAAETIGVALPEKVWCRDNSKHIKPDPKSLLEAAASIGVPPCDCVFVGDFLYDLQGARRAGIRAVLVQRDEPDWNEWSDVSYPAMTDFVEALNGEPTPLAPWEYREIYAKRGAKWLNASFDITLALPEATSPTLDCWLARAAALAVGGVSVSEDAQFGPAEWKNNPSFDISMMGSDLASVVRGYLAPRYPMIRVTNEEGLKAPKNSLDLMRFIERKIF